MLCIFDTQMDGHNICALVDSGASHNFISAEYVKRYNKKQDRVTLGDPRSVLPVLGTVGKQFLVDGMKFHQEFVVVPRLSLPIVLGEPFLTQEQAILDFQRRCMHVGTVKRGTIFFKRSTAAKPILQTEPMKHGFPEEYENDFINMCSKFSRLFTKGVNSTTTSTSHKLHLLEDAVPFHACHRRYSTETKQIIAEEVERMLEAGYIEPSQSAYSSPIVIARKKDGTPRFCVDYRRLNSQTKDEPATLPVISETIRDLGNAKVFSSIDLKTGYWQIPMAPESKQLTAFTTPDGATYHFNVMPFGLKNAPSTFQRMMTQKVLAGCLRKFALVYLDDIIIFSDTFEDHLKHIHLVLERLQLHNLQVSPDKCRFAQTSINYLGHHIIPDGIEPQAVHIKNIKDAKKPESKKQLKSFLGLCGWLHEFVPRFANVTAPLTDLLRTKQRKLSWSTAAETAFTKIKTIFSSPLRLHRPDPTKPFVLQTDASSRGIAAVLYQEPSRKIISFASAKLSRAQERYHVNEQECLAVVWAIKHFKQYLGDKPFTLRTDNKALLWLSKFRDQNAKLTRWSLLLQEYKFKVEHVCGSENELADLLSRNPDAANRVQEDEEADIEKMSVPQIDPKISDHLKPLHLAIISIAELANEIKENQLQNRHARSLVEAWNQIHEDGPTSPAEEKILREYNVHDNLLWRRNPQGDQLIVPQDLHQHVLYNYHDAAAAGHPGTKETLRAISQSYYWLGLSDDVQQYVKKCWICASLKRGPLQEKAPLKPHNPTTPWEVVAIDIMGPYTKTTKNNRFVFVITDLFSRWVEAYATAKTESSDVIQILEEEVFTRFGYPKAILSDNGPQFTSIEWDGALRRWGALHWTTPVYHPQANPTERRIQEIKKCLRIHLANENKSTWDQHLNKALFNIRCRRNEATQHTPATLLLGYDLRRPGEWLIGRPDPDEPVDREEKRQKHVQEAHMNEHRYRQRYAGGTPPPIRFTPGQKVMERIRMKGTKPFEPRWSGPHTIIEEAGENTYWIRRYRTADPVKVHVNDLRGAPPRRQRQQHHAIATP